MNIKKFEKLKFELAKLDNLAVAFSGGVDSSFLAKVANDALKQKFMAVTIKTDYMSNSEINEAVNFAKKYNINHQILEIKTHKNIKNNPQNRCYVCKKEIFAHIIQTALKIGFTNIADGTNKDDLSEFRPGIKALKELNILSPLINFSKNEIRELSKMLNLQTWDKPSSPCLLTRIPHNYQFSKMDINLVEKIENLLKQNGYLDIRARFNGNDIKLEMSHLEMKLFVQDSNFKNIIKTINDCVKGQILLDLKGIREEILS